MTDQLHQHHSVRGQSQLVRPHYSQGLMLQDDDLTQAVEYARNLNKLVFHKLLGCGVVCGLEVRLHNDGCKVWISVGSGLALDGSGEPVEVTEPQTIELGKKCEDLSTERWVLIRRQEQSCMPRGLSCNPEDDAHATVYTRLRDGFEIRLVDKDGRAGACGCERPKDGQGNDSARNACFAQRLGGDCDCGCGSAWVVLGYFANIKADKDTDPAKSKDGLRADHRVRKFIRPALEVDPLWPKPDPLRTAAQDPFKLISSVAKANEESAKAAESLAVAVGMLATALGSAQNVDPAKLKEALDTLQAAADSAKQAAADAAAASQKATDQAAQSQAGSAA